MFGSDGGAVGESGRPEHHSGGRGYRDDGSEQGNGVDGKGDEPMWGGPSGASLTSEPDEYRTHGEREYRQRLRVAGWSGDVASSASLQTIPQARDRLTEGAIQKQTRGGEAPVDPLEAALNVLEPHLTTGNRDEALTALEDHVGSEGRAGEELQTRTAVDRAPGELDYRQRLNEAGGQSYGRGRGGAVSPASSEETVIAPPVAVRQVTEDADHHGLDYPEYLPDAEHCGPVENLDHEREQEAWANEWRDEDAATRARRAAIRANGLRGEREGHPPAAATDDHWRQVEAREAAQRHGGECANGDNALQEELDLRPPRATWDPLAHGANHMPTVTLNHPIPAAAPARPVPHYAPTSSGSRSSVPRSNPGGMDNSPLAVQPVGASRYQLPAHPANQDILEPPPTADQNNGQATAPQQRRPGYASSASWSTMPPSSAGGDDNDVLVQPMGENYYQLPAHLGNQNDTPRPPSAFRSPSVPNRPPSAQKSGQQPRHAYAETVPETVAPRSARVNCSQQTLLRTVSNPGSASNLTLPFRHPVQGRSANPAPPNQQAGSPTQDVLGPLPTLTHQNLARHQSHHSKSGPSTAATHSNWRSQTARSETSAPSGASEILSEAQISGDPRFTRDQRRERRREERRTGEARTRLQALAEADKAELGYARPRRPEDGTPFYNWNGKWPRSL